MERQRGTCKEISQPYLSRRRLAFLIWWVATTMDAESHGMIPEERRQSHKRRSTSYTLKCENQQAGQAEKAAGRFSCSPGQKPPRASLPAVSQGSGPHGSSPRSSWETRAGLVKRKAAREKETGTKDKGNQETASPFGYLYLSSFTEPGREMKRSQPMPSRGQKTPTEGAGVLE